MTGVPEDPRTTLVLVRHGVTAHTSAKLFSGGLGGSDPGLSDKGRAQVRATADWLAEAAPTFDALLTSPVRRTRESAAILADRWGIADDAIGVEPGFAEMEYGVWDGLTVAEVAAKHPAAYDRWHGSTDVAPEGGESIDDARARVRDALDRTLVAHPGRTVVVASHVTPIKLLVAEALGVPAAAVLRMQLYPASVCVLTFRPLDSPPDTRPPGVLRVYNARPPGTPPIGTPPSTW